MTTFRELGDELAGRLHLKTYPVAINMVKHECDIPEEAVRPKRGGGYRLATCQGFAMSRREGTVIAMLMEDMWCSESVIGLGLGEAPKYFLDGYTRFPGDVASLEAGRNWAHDFPRFEVSKYVGVVSSPLTKANFVPDVVMLYCDSTQLKVMLSAAAWESGVELSCTVSAKGSCVYAIVPVVQHQRCQVTVPCGGDKRYALSQDDEMIFTFPGRQIEELLTALRCLDEHSLRLPLDRRMAIEYELSESYLKTGRLMGMDL